jgi:hypothetical protein
MAASAVRERALNGLPEAFSTFCTNKANLCTNKGNYNLDKAVIKG